MTKPQKEMLAQIAAGADVNLIAQITRLLGDKRAERRTEQTILALLKQRMLGYSRTGGLEISQLGCDTAAITTCHKRTVVLPSVGVRRHRITLTDRPSIVRIERAARPVVVGESIDRFADHPTGWAVTSILCILAIIAFSVMAVVL